MKATTENVKKKLLHTHGGTLKTHQSGSKAASKRYKSGIIAASKRHQSDMKTTTENAKKNIYSIVMEEHSKHTRGTRGNTRNTLGEPSGVAWGNRFPRASLYDFLFPYSKNPSSGSGTAFQRAGPPSIDGNPSKGGASFHTGGTFCKVLGEPVPLDPGGTGPPGYALRFLISL